MTGSRADAGGLNPLTLLTGAVVVVALTLLVDAWQFSAAVLAAVLVPALVLSGQHRRILAAAAAILLPTLLSIALINVFFYPEGREVLLAAGLVRITAEGTWFAVAMAFRLCVFVLAFLIFSFTVRAEHLTAALVARRWDPKAVYVLAAALRLAPDIASRAADISAAQQARGLVIRGGAVSRGRALLMLLVPLVVGLLSDVDERGRALEARGLGLPGPRTSFTEAPDSPAQRRFRRSALLLLLLFAVLWIGWRWLR